MKSKRPVRHACEEFSHPECDMKLLLIVGRDGATPQARRKLACDTMGVNDDKHLKRKLVLRTWDQLEQLDEYEG